MKESNNILLEKIKSQIATQEALSKKLLKDKLHLVDIGFYETADIFLRIKNRKDIIYSIYNNCYFNNDSDIEFLTLLKKYENSVSDERYDANNNVHFLPGGPHLLDLNYGLPKKWYNFLLEFYLNYFENKDDADVVIQYLILLFRSLALQKPRIVKGSDSLLNHLYVEYDFDELYSSTIGSDNLLLNNIFFDKKKYIESFFYPNEFFPYFLLNMEPQIAVVNKKYFQVVLKTKADLSLSFDIKNSSFGMIIPYIDEGLLFVLLRILVESIIYFPIGLRPMSFSDDTLKKYKDIINDEYDYILSLLLINDFSGRSSFDLLKRK